MKSTGFTQTAPRRSATTRRWALLAIMASACGWSAPAFAGTAQADIQIGIVQSLQMMKARDLDFGDIVPTAAGGMVVLVPTVTATCNTSGGLVHVGACQPAEFFGYGASNQIVRIKLPPSHTITLTGPGPNMTVTSMTLDASPGLISVGNGQGFMRYRIDSPSGLFAFRVGGTLNVKPNQAPGVYSTSFEVRLDYQ